MRSTAINWSHSTGSNVCTVDWSRLANYAYSICVFRHVKMVTNALIVFLKFLIKNGMNIKTVSIAGHSLGTQSCFIYLLVSCVNLFIVITHKM